jgi:riboflavin synthase, alpha subunit
MFTGIVEEIGTVTAIQRGATSARLTILGKRVREGTQVGDSIAVSGVCLTVVELRGDHLSFDAVPETLNRSSLKSIRAGDSVNLERSLAAGQRLGGHFVQGHVDGVATLKSVQQQENARVLRVAPPGDLMRYIAPKGSVTLDGISLTVADVDAASFTVWIIPHTFENTTLQFRKTGDPLNIETDMLARYLERLLSARSGGITEACLEAAGFD